MKKKTLFILLAVILFCLVACDFSSNSTNTSSTNPTIRFSSVDCDSIYPILVGSSWATDPNKSSTIYKFTSEKKVSSANYIVPYSTLMGTVREFEWHFKSISTATFPDDDGIYYSIYSGRLVIGSSDYYFNYDTRDDYIQWGGDKYYKTADKF